jgi:hypothetical protein
MLNTTVPVSSEGAGDEGGGSDSSNDELRRRKRLLNMKWSSSESVPVRWMPRDASAAGVTSAEMQWQDLTSTSAANLPALAMHTMTVVEGVPTYMVIFGGLKSDKEVSRGLYMIDLDDASASWVDMSGGPDAPTPRFGHSGAALNGRLYVYGGWIQVGGQPDGGLYVLDVAKAEWKSLANLPGRPPYGRAMFTMVTVSPNCLCVCVCVCVCVCA